jgi:hypothetical protein
MGLAVNNRQPHREVIVLVAVGLIVGARARANHLLRDRGEHIRAVDDPRVRVFGPLPAIIDLGRRWREKDGASPE